MRRLSSLGSKHLAHRKGRSVLTALGIVLGVAILFGVQVANASTSAGIDNLIESFTGATDVIVQPVGSFDATMPERVQRELQATEGVKIAVGSFGFGTQLRTEASDAPFELTLRGSDLDYAKQIHPFVFESGRAYRRGAQEMVLPKRTADELKVKAGDRLDVPTRFGARTVLVAGILADEGAGAAFEGQIAYTSLETARALDGRGEVLSTVRVVLNDEQNVAKWIRRHGDELGDGYEVVNASTLADGFKDFIGVFGMTLSFFAAITLFVGSFLIYLTLSMAVIERVRSYGTMRALGATRAQVRKVVVAEALVLGAISTVLGLGLGLGIARGLLAMISSLFEIDTPGMTITGQAVAVAVVIGMLITLASSLIPARRAARLSPVVAMKGDYGAETRLSRMWIVGLVSLLIGTGLGLSTNTIAATASTPFLLLGSILLVPLLLRPLAGLLGKMTSRIAHGAGDVAVLHLVKERSRSAYTLGLIMVVMAMIFSIGGLFASLSSALELTLDRQFGADIQVEASGTLGERFETDLRKIGGIDRVTAFRFGESRFVDVNPEGENDDTVFVRIIDPETYWDVEGFQWAVGDDASARAALRRGGTILLPETQVAELDDALRNAGKRLGDTIRLRTSKGDHTFKIAGTYTSFAGPPIAVVGLKDGRRFFNAGDPSAYHASVKPGVSVEAVRARIEKELTTRYNATVQTSQAFKEEVTSDFRQYFNIIYAILAVAAVVGLLGLANTLAMSVLQRYREIGILRAVGTTRGQVRRMVLVESATLACVAFALALPLGFALSVLNVRSTGRAFGFAVDYVYPASWVPLLAVFGIVVAVLAALAPGRRAARLQIVNALQFE